MGTAISADNSFKILAPIWSGPVALFMSKFFSSLSTVRARMAGNFCMTMDGSARNWSSTGAGNSHFANHVCANKSALLLDSVIHVPSCMRNGGTAETRAFLWSNSRLRLHHCLSFFFKLLIRVFNFVT